MTSSGNGKWRGTVVGDHEEEKEEKEEKEEGKIRKRKKMREKEKEEEEEEYKGNTREHKQQQTLGYDLTSLYYV